MMNASCDETCQGFEIRDSVLGYLNSHPNAADTLDGIVDWWLPRQRFISAQERVEAVLKQLVECGVLKLRLLPSGAALYALDRGSASTRLMSAPKRAFTDT